MAINKSISIVLLLCLAFGLTARSAYAQQLAPLSARLAKSGNPEFVFSAAPAHKSDEKLRSDLLKLTEEARSGKLRLNTQSQLPPGKSHNLSKTAKIAIIAGVAVVVVGLVGWYAFTHTSCKSRCVL
jgi:hypothetical protein